jgi:hypothetical protein
MSIIKLNATRGLEGALPAVSGASLTGITAGISEADEWRLTSDVSGGANPITGTWERNDTNMDKIGTGMSESSGVFTFPSTGIYAVNYHVYATLSSAADRVADMYIQACSDGSTFNITIGYHSFNLFNSGSNTHGGGETGAIFDCTNVSTHKVRFATGFGNGSTQLKGSTNQNYTWVRFVKLGDT